MLEYFSSVSEASFCFRPGVVTKILKVVAFLFVNNILHLSGARRPFIMMNKIKSIKTHFSVLIVISSLLLSKFLRAVLFR